MFNLPQQKLNFIETIRYSILLWGATLLSSLPLCLGAGIISSWPIYLKHFIDPNNTVIFVIIAVAFAIISLIPYMSIFAKLGGATQGQTYSVSQSLAAGLLKLPAGLLLLLLAIIIAGLPILIGILLFMATKSILMLSVCIAIFFILSIYLNCIFPLLINDNVSPLNAVVMSIHLVKSHWWYVAGIVFIISLFTVAVENISRSLASDIGFIIAFSVMLPLHIASSIIILQQLKIRAAS